MFRDQGRLVAGLCRGLLRDVDEAEDAAQQTFLSAHGAFLRGAEPRDPAAWLTTIARNECLARIRERMRRPLPFADTRHAASTGDPVVEAIRRADMTALWRAVRALAPQQREAMLLREFGGLSYDELAVALGVSLPAVESLLFRARTRLRFELKGVAAAVGSFLPRLLSGGGAAKVAGVTMAAGLVGGSVVATAPFRQYVPPVTRHLSRRPAVRRVQPPPAARTPAAPTPTPAPVLPSAFERRVEEPAAEQPTHAADETVTTSDEPAIGADHEGGDGTLVVETARRSSIATVSPDGGDGEPTPTTTTTTPMAATSSEPDGGDASTATTEGDGGGSTTPSGDGSDS